MKLTGILAGLAALLCVAAAVILPGYALQRQDKALVGAVQEAEAELSVFSKAEGAWSLTERLQALQSGETSFLSVDDAAAAAVYGGKEEILSCLEEQRLQLLQAQVLNTFSATYVKEILLEELYTSYYYVFDRAELQGFMICRADFFTELGGYSFFLDLQSEKLIGVFVEQPGISELAEELIPDELPGALADYLNLELSSTSYSADALRYALPDLKSGESYYAFAEMKDSAASAIYTLWLSYDGLYVGFESDAGMIY